MRNKKIMDVVAPTDVWQRKYARLEYLRLGMQTVFDKKIIVTDDITNNSLWGVRCRRYPRCSNRCWNEDFVPYGLCSERCDGLAAMESDAYQQGDY